jgi:predicted RNase H-like nuclease (RuvC/YqgF family)
MYTLGQAAKATGKAKSSISAAIKDGTISAKRNEDGSYIIDPAELHRVFPPASSPNSAAEHRLDDSEQGNLRYENGVLKGELNQLRERLADIDTQHDRERRVLSDQIDDLRKRLDQAEQERREKDRQLTALLSDQRQKAQEPGTALQRTGFLGRFLGRRG